MTKISTFFIENYKFTYVLTFFFVFFGLGGLVNTNSESFPTVNMGQVIITTIYQGATAEDIESQITKPIEDQIRSVTGIKEVKSVSQPGESQILTIVDIDNYGVEKVIADLQRAVDRVTDLPKDLENPPYFAEIKTDEFPVIEVAVVGENIERIRDRVIVELQEDLEDNQKISSVRTLGFRERQFNIYIDNKKLNQLHVGLSEVTRAIAAANVAIPGGVLESKDGRLLVKIDGKMKTAEALEKIIIRANFSGSKIRLSDVAVIEDGQEDARTLGRFEGRPATFLVISKKSGADIVQLASEVKERIAFFSEKYSGKLDFQIYNDEGIRVGNRLDVLNSNGVAGLVLVVFFLMLFLPGRVGIMAAFSLPLAVFATFGFMQVAGFSINTITILAMVISIGMLVDNAVVIAENYVRLKGEGERDKDAAIESIRSLWLPITATALTTIAAFLPMLVTKGIMGQFIRGIPLVVTASLVISLFECFILLPVRLVKDKKNNAPKSDGGVRAFVKKDWFAKYIVPRFIGFVRGLVRFRYFSAAGFLGLIAFAIFMMTEGNKFVLFPADQTERYLARLEMPQGTPIADTDEALAKVSLELREKMGDDLAFVTAKAGLAEQDPNDPKGKRGQNVGLITILMTETAKNTLKTNDVLERMREIHLEGAKELTFEAYINGPPVGAPVTAIFRSNDGDQLKKVISYIRGKMAEVEGITDIGVDDIFGEKEVFLEINTARANQLGLNTFDIGNSVRTAVAGFPVAQVNINNREVNYFVRLKDGDRKNTKDLLGLKIMNPKGDLIPLARVAKLKESNGSPHIKRFDFKPAKTITANVNDDIITSVEANAKVLGFFNEIKDQYRDVTFNFGGEGERTQESFQSLMQALVLSLIGIFALLVFLFRSYIKPLIILTTIPLGLVGVSIAFFVHQRPISFLALIGLVGLGGIIVNSGIVLISFIEELRLKSKESLSEILVQATGLRLRAVVVTSLTTVSGLLPTAYGIGGSDEFIIPMTLAMAWGLVSGTILALLWVPCAYAITEDINALIGKLGRKINPKNLMAKKEVA